MSSEIAVSPSSPPAPREMEKGSDPSENSIATTDRKSEISNTNNPIFHSDDAPNLKICKEKLKNEESNDSNSGEFLHDLYHQLKRTYSETDHLTTSSDIPSPPHWVAKPNIGNDEFFQQTHNWEVKSSNPFFNKTTVVQRYSMRADAILCSLAFSHDGSCFAYADSHNVFLMRSEDGSLIKAWENPPSVEKSNLQTRVIQFSNNSKYIALGISNNKILLLTTESNDVPVVLNGHVGQVSSLLFYHNDDMLISGGYDGYLCFWDLNTMSLLKVIKHRSEEIARNKSSVEGKIVALAESNDNRYIAVGFMDGIVGIYENTFTKDMMKFIAHDKYLFDLAISKTSGLLATASADASVKLWDLNAIAVCQKTLKEHHSIVMTVCFSTLDQILFTGSKDEMLMAWDIKKGTSLFTIAFHENTVFQITHHPTKKSLLSCSGDGMISMWDYTLP